jgi:hypothetical protein
MKTLKTISVILSLSFLVGCASSAKKLNRLSIGMTKADAIQAIGNPRYTSASGGAEYLVYVLDASKIDPILPEEYYVRIVSGKVDSYGRIRDLPGGRIPKE